jgi:hypothetical protein
MPNVALLDGEAVATVQMPELPDSARPRSEAVFPWRPTTNVVWGAALVSWVSPVHSLNKSNGSSAIRTEIEQRGIRQHILRVTRIPTEDARIRCPQADAALLISLNLLDRWIESTYECPANHPRPPSCRSGRAEAASCYNVSTFAIDFEPGSAPECCTIVSNLSRVGSQRKHSGA